MTTSHRRIALLTGASISALGVSRFPAPAFAAPHDGLVDGTYEGHGTTNHTVTICDIATNADCFFGVIDNTTGSATVDTTVTGKIVQSDNGGDITLDMTNLAADSAEIGAIAGGAAAGNAYISGTALLQSASGDDVAINLTMTAISWSTPLRRVRPLPARSSGPALPSAAMAPPPRSHRIAGDLTVVASAQQHELFTLGQANAYVSFGATQIATGFDGNASANIHNYGSMNVDAVATATAGFGIADAHVLNGLHQSADAAGTGAAASVGITNEADGVIDVHAEANANVWDFEAQANATVGGITTYSSSYAAISQKAFGDSGADANATITNGGAIDIAAIAHAGAYVSEGLWAQTPAYATAHANVVGGIYQRAAAYGTNTYDTGDAAALIANNSTIGVNANADAVATKSAQATATNDDRAARLGEFRERDASITGEGSDRHRGPCTGPRDERLRIRRRDGEQRHYPVGRRLGGGSANALISQSGIGIHATALAFGDDFRFANAAVHSGICKRPPQPAVTLMRDQPCGRQQHRCQCDGDGR